MMYVCLGCYTQRESIKTEVEVPTYDAPGGSVDSFDFVVVEYSPFIDGLCFTCHSKANPVVPDVDSLEDDDLPF